MTCLAVLADFHGNLPALKAVIDEFRTAKLAVLPYQMWKQHHYAGQQDSVDLLQEFLALDDVSAYLPPAYISLTSELHRD